MKVVVTGATGFVGRYTVEHLLSSGHSVNALSRSDAAPAHNSAGSLRVISGVDVTDASTLSPEYFAGADAVVHLVGIIAERPPRQTFSRIHVQGTRNVVDAARRGGIGKLIYVSAIGVSEYAAAEYSRTKFAAEEIVRASGIPYTILRPSIILGKDGEFTKQMRDLIRFAGLPVKIPAPVIPVPGSGQNRFQPIYINNLTSCISQGLTETIGADMTLEVAGADRVTFDQIIEAFAAAEGVSKPLLHVPLALLSIAARFVEKFPTPPFTGDQLKNLKLDNVADTGLMREMLGVDPMGFQQQIDLIYADDN